MPWKVFEENGQHCVYKLAADGGKGDKVTCHDTAAAATAHVKALYANAEPMGAERVYDEFVSTQPGDSYRLLPFGPIKRASGGPVRNLTPELAAQFKLPHFQPPIKLGSHEDTTPAGGHIAALFVRNDGDPQTDGLWVKSTLTEKGARAWGDGDYKYHSPEIIWPGGGLEDATTGQYIPGPLVVGDALLHVPALGEATALYTSQIISTGETMTVETVQVDKTVWDNLKALFGGAPAQQQPPAPAPTIPDEYKAAMQERDEFKARLDKLEADRLQAENKAKLAAELKSDRFGAAFKDETAAQDAAGVLASMSPEQQEWTMQKLSALAKQIDYSKIGKELGTDAASVNTNPRQVFAAAVEAKMKEAKVDYTAAYNLVKTEQPEMFQAYADAVLNKAKGE